MSQKFSFLFCYFVIITVANVILFLKNNTFMNFFFKYFLSTTYSITFVL